MKCAALMTLAVLAFNATASESLVVESTWVGGLFAAGAKMNDFAHQNYCVGYGTTPGFPRTAERRSFFWFDIPEFEGTVLSATVTLKLVTTTSLIFGLGPGTPPGPEHEETFMMGAIPTSPFSLVEPGLPPSMVSSIFSTMDGTPVADLTVFSAAIAPFIPTADVVGLTELGTSVREPKRGAP